MGKYIAKIKLITLLEAFNDATHLHRLVFTNDQ